MARGSLLVLCRSSQQAEAANRCEALLHLISPLEGEMPGRAEGGMRHGTHASYLHPNQGMFFIISGDIGIMFALR